MYDEKIEANLSQTQLLIDYIDSIMQFTWQQYLSDTFFGFQVT